MNLVDLGKLRKEIELFYPGEAGFSDFLLFLSDNFGDSFDQRVILTATLSLKFHAVLLNIGAARRMPDLLQALRNTFGGSEVIKEVYDAERAAYGQRWPDQQVRERRAALNNRFLTCRGFPFIDRRNLALTLDNLLDENSITRIGVVTGIELCGKTWVRHLLHSKCAALGHTFVDLDLERMAPGNNARLVCEELMRQLAGKDIPVREQDTKSGQYVQRMAYEVEALRQQFLRTDPRPLIIAIDSLNKNVGDTVLDFVEQLTSATRSQNLPNTKMILLGFPRAAARFAFAAREVINPLTERDIADYLAEIGQAIGAPISDDESARVARTVIARSARPDETALADRLLALADMSSEVHEYVESMVRR